MPKLSAKKLAQRAQRAQLHQHRIGPTNRNPHNHFQMSPYPRTGIHLFLDIDGTIVRLYDKDQPIPPCPSLLKDFIHFCLKACESVSFYTYRKPASAYDVLEALIGPAFLKRVYVYTRKDMPKSYEFGKGIMRFKWLGSNYNSEQTLIIDDNPAHYFDEELDNLLIAKPGDKFDDFYTEIVRFLKTYKPHKSLRNQLVDFVKTTEYCGIWDRALQGVGEYTADKPKRRTRQAN